MTKINASSTFNRGDQVTIKGHPELGVFTIVDISASSYGITNIKVSRTVTCDNDKNVFMRITDLTDAELSLSKFKTV